MCVIASSLLAKGANNKPQRSHLRANWQYSLYGNEANLNSELKKERRIEGKTLVL